MVRKIAILILLAAACLLTGCATLTVDQMYCIPKRPQSFSDLQSVIDAAMEGMDYSAPRAGEHQQTVQMADLDGDGIREYLVFARDGGDKSLKILIFAQKENDYVHTDTLECTGSSFERVVYTQLDSSEGLELLVGCQLDGQVPRSVSVYGYGNDRLQQVMMSNYTEFLTCDLNEDGAADIQDAIYLIWNTLFPDLYPVTADADFNNDGIRNTDDAVKLLWHAMFPEQYPLT